MSESDSSQGSSSPGRSSRASVPTERGGRYGKQLASHLSRRLETSWDEETGTGLVTFDSGHSHLTTTPSTLELTADVDPRVADADVAEQLARIEDVVGRHLARFGAKDELVVSWLRADGSAGRQYVGAGPEEHGQH
jgi:hypothetical protein